MRETSLCGIALLLTWAAFAVVLAVQIEWPPEWKNPLNICHYECALVGWVTTPELAARGCECESESGDE